MDGAITYEGKVFYKIYETGDFYQQVIHPPGPCNESYSYTGEYRGAIRFENGKTYIYNGFDEYMIMDFTLGVGDTLYSYISPGLIVGSIDSVLIGDEYRKRFNFTNVFICNWMIEGIGHETGLFEPMGLILEFSSEFICYGENGEPLFGDMGCELNVGEADLRKEVRNIHVFPNPATDKITIENSPQKNRISTWSIIDIHGRKRLQGEFNEKNSLHFKIDLQILETGSYFLILQLENGRMVYERIVKSN